MNHLEALAASLALIWLGASLLNDVRNARSSGVGHFFFQWPNNFERSHQPAAFWWCIVLYTFCGYLSFVFAAVLASHVFV